jgi:hypothetical protein
MAQQVFADISNSGETSCSDYSDGVLQTSNDTVSGSYYYYDDKDAVLQSSALSGSQSDIASARIVLEHLHSIQQQSIHIHHGKCDAVVPVDIVEHYVKQAPNAR